MIFYTQVVDNVFMNHPSIKYNKSTKILSFFMHRNVGLLDGKFPSKDFILIDKRIRKKHWS